jgi:hypothetical protein
MGIWMLGVIMPMKLGSIIGCWTIGIPIDMFIDEELGISTLGCTIILLAGIIKSPG